IADIKKVVVSEEVTISGGSYPIHGELVKPKNPLSDMKTVIIVGDAGPTSRDGGTYVNSPYKDIAEGLGSKGIASFRFDKRYYTYGEEFSVEEDLAFTLKEDYVDDYKSIMTYIGSRNDINKDNLYVIGVGQGGNLIPMLEEASGLAKGYVFMGANQSPAEDIIANMSKYLVNVMPGLTDADKAESIGLINTELQLIKGLTEGSADDFFFDQSTKYWLSYKGYNAATKANSISKPMMFLHGGNDLAVPVTEIDKFKSVLSGKDNVIFKTYSGLTSEFIVGAKNFEAYSVKGKVSQAVIDDIAIFVGK
ncbi:MAG: alpha/beta hydrolase, partial [Clostridium sp.]